MDSADTNLLTVEQAAKERGLSVAAVYRAVREGRLPATRMLGRVVILRKEVNQFQTAGHGGARPNTGKRKVQDAAPAETDWDARNRQRIDLLKRRITHGLSPEEEMLLARLTEQVDAHVKTIAPLPFPSVAKAE